MQVGMIGAGRMGGNMARRLSQNNHRVVVFDQDANTMAVPGLVEFVTPAASLPELVDQLDLPRIVWTMLPAGVATEETLLELGDLLTPGDIVIDGGNSNYKDTIRRGERLTQLGLRFVDVGTSGGIWGLKGGYCLMVGGDAEVVRHVEPLFQTLAPAPDKGYAHLGATGAGHFTKMVHNGIEYGLMQAYAEGFELLEAKTDLDLDLAKIGEVWRYGSVIRSWLLDLIASSLSKDPNMEQVLAYVEDSGEGRWAVEESVDLGIPLPVISAALQTRFRSRQNQPLSARLLSTMRLEFGGHLPRRPD